MARTYWVENWGAFVACSAEVSVSEEGRRVGSRWQWCYQRFLACFWSAAYPPTHIAAGCVEAHKVKEYSRKLRRYNETVLVFLTSCVLNRILTTQDLRF